MAYNRVVGITPSNTTNIQGPKPFTDAVYVGNVGSGGTVAAVFPDGSVVSFTAIAGEILPIAVQRVNNTGTAATALVALYQV